MSLAVIDEQYLSDTADAIREKTGDSALLRPSEFADAISGISGGGGSPLVLLGSDEVTVSTTSTTATTVKTYSFSAPEWGSDCIAICSVIDKAGMRNGYFYSTLSINHNQTTIRTWTVRTSSGGSKVTSGSAYGVYASSMTFTSSGGVRTFSATLTSKYSSSYSLTVNGTYIVKFYYMDLTSIR